jgi:hypothetical protein
MQISLTFQVNLIFMNYFQVNYATYKIQMTSYYVEEGESGEDLDAGVDSAAVEEAVSTVLRWTQRRSRRVAWTRRWLGRRSTWHRGSHEGGVGMRRGPVGGRGGVGADSAVVGEAPTWRWARRRNIPVGDGGNDSSQG